MEGVIVFLWLLIMGGALFVQYIVAKKFEEIAKQKGYGEEKHTCAMCFWLGVVGYLYVIALPDLTGARNGLRGDAKETLRQEVQYPVNVRQHQCPCCRAPIAYGIEECPFCNQLIEWPSE